MIALDELLAVIPASSDLKNSVRELSVAESWMILAAPSIDCGTRTKSTGCIPGGSSHACEQSQDKKMTCGCPGEQWPGVANGD